MSEKKPNPIYTRKKRKNCPVCGQVSYSQNGIHPQCAVKLVDDERKGEIKRRKLEEEDNRKSETKNKTRWQIKCPKCGKPQHVRKKICDCGHKLIANTPPSEND